MKTYETIEKESLLSKIIAALKNTAIYNIFLNENSGRAIDSNSIDPEEHLNYLASNSNCSKEEIKSIEAAFKQANSRMEPLETRVYSTQPEHNEQVNPFKVKESDLKHDILTSKVQKSHDEKCHERDD